MQRAGSGVGCNTALNAVAGVFCLGTKTQTLSNCAKPWVMADVIGVGRLAKGRSAIKSRARLVVGITTMVRDSRLLK